MRSDIILFRKGSAMGLHTKTARIVIALVTVALLGASSASAGIITVEDLSAPVSIVGITGFTTTGADMGGMRVTATFVGGNTETQIWAASGVDSGQVAGNTGDSGPTPNAWVLSQSGDTYSPSSDNWTLTTVNQETEIESILLEGLLGGTQGIVFDRTFGGVEGTVNSALGLTFNSSLPDLMDIRVTYSNPIQVGANPVVGDLFGSVLIQFDTERLGSLGFNAFVNGGVFTFRQDTDTVGLPNGQAPEPGTLLLLGAGLVALYRRRRS
jgi:hypothetical protein